MNLKKKQRVNMIISEEQAFNDANKRLLEIKEQKKYNVINSLSTITASDIKIKEHTDNILKIAKDRIKLQSCDFCGAIQIVDDGCLLRCYRYNFPLPVFNCSCEKSKEEYKLKLIELEKQDKAIRLENFKNEIISRLPKKFKYCSFENYNGFENIINELKDLSKTDSGLFLIGSVGTGKTHLSISFIKKCLSYNYQKGLKKSFMFGDLQFIIDSYFEDKSNFDFAKNVEILLIDDLGTEQLKDWGYSKLYELINYRYNEELQTVINSNLTIVELQSKIGDRTISRIIEMTKKIEVKGEDYRIKKRLK